MLAGASLVYSTARPPGSTCGNRARPLSSGFMNVGLPPDDETRARLALPAPMFG